MKAEELVGLLAEHYRQERKVYPRKKRLFASDIGSEGCRLGMFRKLRDFPQTPKKPGELLMFKQGENLEDEVADSLAAVLAEKTDWELVDRQTSVEYDGITGRLDILMRNKVTGELLVLEVKSKRGRAFNFLDEPKEPNVRQTNFYQEATGATKGLLVYVDREGQNFIKIFPIEPDKEALDKAIADQRLLLDDENEPERLTLTLNRNHNKGDDSFSIDMPWQMSWCNDAECPCKKAAGSAPFGKVVAKGKKDDTGNITEIYPVEGHEDLLEMVISLATKDGYMK